MNLISKNISTFKNQIEKSNNILIVVHRFPDIDAIGSALAFKEQMELQKKNTVLWVQEPLDNTFAFLPNVKDIQNNYPENFNFDCLVVLDASDFKRVEGHEKIKTQRKTVINIDHHPDNTKFGTINIIELVSSVGELLTKLFTDLNWEITKTMAQNLYGAITFDTGRFAHSNVTAETLRKSGLLIEKGADNNRIFQAMENNKSLPDLKLLQYALSNMVYNQEKNVAFTTLKKNSPSGKVKVIDTLRQLKNINVTLVFQEINESKTKVSLRSEQSFDVSKFAHQFGGGGHKKASGIVIEEPLETVVRKVISKLYLELE